MPPSERLLQFTLRHATAHPHLLLSQCASSRHHRQMHTTHPRPRHRPDRASQWPEPCLLATAITRLTSTGHSSAINTVLHTRVLQLRSRHPCADRSPLPSTSSASLSVDLTPQLLLHHHRPPQQHPRRPLAMALHPSRTCPPLQPPMWHQQPHLIPHGRADRGLSSTHHRGAQPCLTNEAPKQQIILLTRFLLTCLELHTVETPPRCATPSPGPVLTHRPLGVSLRGSILQMSTAQPGLQRQVWAMSAHLLLLRLQTPIQSSTRIGATAPQVCAPITGGNLLTMLCFMAECVVVERCHMRCSAAYLRKVGSAIDLAFRPVARGHRLRQFRMSMFQPAYRFQPQAPPSEQLLPLCRDPPCCCHRLLLCRPAAIAVYSLRHPN